MQSKNRSTEKDWEATLKALCQKNAWEELWQLVTEASLIWSAQILECAQKDCAGRIRYSDRRTQVIQRKQLTGVAVTVIMNSRGKG